METIIFIESHGWVIDGFRWAITGDAGQIYKPGYFLSLGITVLMVILGIISGKQKDPLLILLIKQRGIFKIE
jgi:hypothetical protein